MQTPSRNPKSWPGLAQIYRQLARMAQVQEISELFLKKAAEAEWSLRSVSEEANRDVPQQTQIRHLRRSLCEASRPAKEPHSLLADAFTPNSGATILLAEPRDLLRACATYWLKASFPEFKVHAVPNLIGLLDSVPPASTAGILISNSHRDLAWWRAQVRLVRATRPGVMLVALVDADDLEAKALARELGLQRYLSTSSSEKAAIAILRKSLCRRHHLIRGGDSA